MSPIKTKQLHNSFWMCVVIVLCLMSNILIQPWYSSDYESYPDKAVLEESIETINSYPLYFKVIYAPVIEEMIFRSPILIFILLQGKYKKLKGNPYILVVLFGLLFGFGHVSNGGIYTLPSAIFSVTFDGIMFGILVIKTRGIISSITAHSILNLIATL